MKKNNKNHHAGRIISLFIVLCMVLAVAPITAFAGVVDVTGGTTSNVYNHTYHTKVKLTANVTVQDSEGNTVNTYPVSEESDDFLVGNVSDDAVQAEITRLEAVVNSQLPSGAVKSNRTTSTTFDHFESSYILIGDGGGESSASTLDVHEYQIYAITDDWTVQQSSTATEIIDTVEISGATVDFHVGDKPVFTGTVDDDAPYVIDYEGWFGEDNEFISSSDYWNSAHVERDWCDGLITSFKENTEYTYQLYLKLTDEAIEEGYVFGPDTKLKVNGEVIEYQHSGETSVALQIGTELTMTLLDAEANKLTDSQTAQTSDNSNFALWFALLLISVGGVVGTTVYGKKKRVR